jgi:hypothetical protein
MPPVMLTHPMLKAETDRGDDVASRIGTAFTIGLFGAAAIAYTAGRGDAAEAETPPPSAADGHYQACVADAGTTHDAARAAECKRLAEQTDSNRANCLSKLNLPKIYCDASYAPRDPSANCTLPDEIGSVIDAELARARFRCARALAGGEGKL